jgi:uncharacterized membrane-anchored protein
MNIKIPAVPACIVLFAIQLAVPGWMLIGREATLRIGTPYKFETAPVDPVDAFRGRYVALRVNETTASSVEEGVKPVRGQKIYVTVETKPDGYAKLGQVSLKPPAKGDYIRAKSGYGGNNVELPLDRFYMNEKMAPKAERAYIDNSRAGNRNAYILVKVRDGDAVIEDLFMDGKPVVQYLRELEDK